jgi:hypothetical protein
LLIEADVVPENRLQPLMQEMDEILAMIVASIKTLRSRNPKSRAGNSQSGP